MDLGELGFTSVSEYQKFNRLEETGVIDRPTERSLAAPRHCGLPDRMDLGGQVCYWGSRSLNCAWVGTLPNLETDAVVKAIQQAWAAWMAVCGIKVTTTLDRATANIVVTNKRMDGPSRVLAQAELPCGQDRQRAVEIDESEPWVTILDPPRYRVSLVLTLIHEFGHALGLVHGPPGSIMQAQYDASIKRPQGWDIAEAQQRYNAPIVPPTGPPKEPDEPGGEFITIPSYQIPKNWVIE